MTTFERARDFALMAWIGAFLLMVLFQIFRGVGPVQDVTPTPTSEIVDGSEAYYPARDTSFLRYVCCGVVR